MELDHSESGKTIEFAISIRYAILPLGIEAVWLLSTPTAGPSFGAPETIDSASGVFVVPK
jgi:hypothetical protein